MTCFMPLLSSKRLAKTPLRWGLLSLRVGDAGGEGLSSGSTRPFVSGDDRPMGLLGVRSQLSAKRSRTEEHGSHGDRGSA